MKEKITVLLIDDEPDYCFMVKKMLESTNEFEVTVVSDGVQGLCLARENKPAVIILDVNMPSMSGSDVAEHLKNDEDLKGIPVIFLTGIISDHKAEQDLFIERGGQKFLAKPVSTQDLINAICSVVKTNL